MAFSDRVIGGSFLAVSIFVFGYYTFWALISPFFPTDSFIQNLFPAREWAVRLPALILVLGLSVIGAFIFNVLRRQAIVKREKELQKSA
ncbi:Hypothetical protein MSYG_2093 [Malassezia sympodialis ATCC 42132]|uniref:Dolichol phosphate-mannose biosynthesis regulatory protein n=1 Tax=Malassezia sympodialis (strain ATCC 42132) TaxID=1230383 RepID=A0A1M8A5P6_MALS4|nr:Hypothetical protein MSYG_2093 [Malassezia sympodialis ATCC 42132]